MVTEKSTHQTIDYRTVAEERAKRENATVYVVLKDGSHLYLSFDDDFDWNDVVFVAKP